MRDRWTRAASAVLGAALALTLAAGSPAAADPATVPRTTDVVGVGADTTEVLFDDLAADHNTRSPGRRLFSWRTRGSQTIRPKAGCRPIVRPSGSSQGMDALVARQTLPGGRPCVDFARTIRPRLPGDPSTMVFLPFATDGLTWAANATGHAPASLTLAQLADVFTCRARTWDRVGGTSTATIEPMLPIVGPGITYFLEQLGVHEVGACVRTGVPQDQGTDPLIAGNPNALVWYSIAKYLAQAEYGHDDVHGSLSLRRIEGLTPTVRNPATDRVEINNGQATGVPAFPPPLMITQSIVLLTEKNGRIPHHLAHLFVGPNSWLCSTPRAQARIAEYGFLPHHGATCGKPE
ncbi:substrate-binding domain-containing protein [Actinomadura roseirufa]|uniref:substrate-binding domain-containing protein n=1 Tax=Actinomadura roseirufa TaxID=2094049 RepID=UPI001041613A|nr:substrate-binding domain-containing protein [Actinomadura roseirufa]